jgi:preprotein translocase SecE subunit
VARDRQRAKQRRRRAGAGGPPTGKPRARARDDARQAEPTEPRESEPTEDREPTGAPAPTEGAFPDVEEARRAEAGVPLHHDEEPADGELVDGVYPDELYGDDEMERAPDELEAGSSEYAPDPAVAEERAGARTRRKRGKILTFLGHVVDELRRVQWPDRRQTGQGTAVTLGFVVVAGGFLGLMDAIWKPLVEAIL